MKNIIFFFAMIFCFSLTAQRPISLPPLNEIDSIRLQRRTVQGDTAEQGRLILMGYVDSNMQVTTTPWYPISAINEYFFNNIANAQASSAGLTKQFFAESVKLKGLNQFSKIIRQTATGSARTYEDIFWERYGTSFSGQWSLQSRNGIAAHTFTVNASGQARRDTGTPRYQGRFYPLSFNRIELRGYIVANQSLILDMVQDGIWATPDGLIVITKLR